MLCLITWAGFPWWLMSGDKAIVHQVCLPGKGRIHAYLQVLVAYAAAGHICVYIPVSCCRLRSCLWASRLVRNVSHYQYHRRWLCVVDSLATCDFVLIYLPCICFISASISNAIITRMRIKVVLVVLAVTPGNEANVVTCCLARFAGSMQFR